MEYIAVFEYNDFTSGKFKNRFCYYYKDEQSFNELHRPHPGIEIIARGYFTKFELAKHLCFVPKVCHFTFMVENLFEEKTGILTLKQIDDAMAQARDIAEANAETQRYFRIKMVDTGYLKRALQLLSVGSRDKNLLMKAVIDAYHADTDSIGITRMNKNIVQAYAHFRF